jgi:hypothetical protein
MFVLLYVCMLVFYETFRLKINILKLLTNEQHYENNVKEKIIIKEKEKTNKP